jgi:hypothetical protein
VAGRATRRSASSTHVWSLTRALRHRFDACLTSGPQAPAFDEAGEGGAGSSSDGGGGAAAAVIEAGASKEEDEDYEGSERGGEGAAYTPTDADVDGLVGQLQAAVAAAGPASERAAVRREGRAGSCTAAAGGG